MSKAAVVAKPDIITVIIEDVGAEEREGAGTGAGAGAGAEKKPKRNLIRNNTRVIESEYFHPQKSTSDMEVFHPKSAPETQTDGEKDNKLRHRKKNIKTKPVMGKDLFVSYSRLNKERVLSLIRHLETMCDKTFWFDMTDIPPAAVWWDEIVTGIREAQNCLFFLSNGWIQSGVCQQELQCAVENGKSIIPIIIEPISYTETPHAIAKLNWIFLRETDDPEAGFDNLLKAISVNLDLVKRHTKLLQMANAWIESGRRKDHLLRDKALDEAKDVLIDCAVGHECPTIVPDQAVYVRERESQRIGKRRRRLAIAAFTAFLAFLLVALAVSVFYAITAEIAKRDTQFAYGIANAQRDRAEKTARENLYQSFGSRAAGYVNEKRTSVGLLFGAEALRVMAKEKIPNLHSTLQAHRNAMASLGADWVYEGEMAYDVLPFISNDGNAVAFLANASTAVVVSGISSHVFRKQYVRLDSNCAPVSQFHIKANQYIVEHNFFRLSKDGTVLLIAVNRLLDIQNQSDVALCVADFRQFMGYGKVYEATPVPIGPFADVYYSDSGVIVVSTTRNGTTNLLVWASVDELLSAKGVAAAKMILQSPVLPFHLFWGASFLDCTLPDSRESHFLVLVENSMVPDDARPNRARIHAFKPLTGTPTKWPKGNRVVEIDAPFFDQYTYFTDMDPIWFVKRHDPTCTWITDAVGSYKLNAPALFDKVPPMLANRTTSITARNNERPFADSSGANCNSFLVMAFPIDSEGNAVAICYDPSGKFQEMMIVNYTEDFAVKRYIPNYVLFTPFAFIGAETVAVVQKDSDLFWSPTGLVGETFLDRPRFGSFHLPFPRYLIPDVSGTNLFSFADDGMAVWTPSNSVTSRSPVVTSNYPCNTAYQLPILSHGSAWSAYICVTQQATVGGGSEFTYHKAFLVNERSVHRPISLTKLYGDNQYFEWAEFETKASQWLAVGSYASSGGNETVDTWIVDIYSLLQHTTPPAPAPAPVLRHRLEKLSASRIQFKGDRIVCGHWLLFQDCLVHVLIDGSVSSNCSLDLSRLFDRSSCNDSCAAKPALAHVQFSENCDRLLLVSSACPCGSNAVFNSTVIRLSETGTASPDVTQRDDFETSVLTLSVNPYFNVTKDRECEYAYFVLSPNGRFLGSVCNNATASAGIDMVVKLFNLSAPLSWTPLWTVSTPGPLTYTLDVTLQYFPIMLSFSPNSQYMALQTRQALAVYDLTRSSFTADPLVLSTVLSTTDQTPRGKTRMPSYPFFSVDSMYLYSLEFYGNRYQDTKAPVYAVHPQAHTASLCRVAARDLTAQEWQQVGLGEKGHPICPGPVYERLTCFGVSYGQAIAVGSPTSTFDTCLLDSYSFAVQFTLTAKLDGEHEVEIESEYTTDIGAYDTACNTLAYSRSASTLKIASLSEGQVANIIVTSSRGDECGVLSLYVVRV